VILFLIFFFLLGTIIGSFLNVVIYRLNTGRSMVNDRSICFSCGKQLAWYELIPVLSFVIQRGKCRKCGAKISWQYITVELATGIIFAAILYFNPLRLIEIPYNSNTILDTFFSIPSLISDLFSMAIWSILIVIFVYDLKHKIIPDRLSYSFAALSFIKLFIGISPAFMFFRVPGLMEIIAGPLFFVPFFLLWYVSNGTWIGLGDGKLALGIGWYLGIVYGLSAIVMAFWIGAAVGIALIIMKMILKRPVFHRLALSIGLGERIMKSEIPFAPFLIIGIALAFFFRIDVLHLALLIGI
jgi:leader peptidase (prepilin peptidase)/N-methyltransferase